MSEIWTSALCYVNNELWTVMYKTSYWTYPIIHGHYWQNSTVYHGYITFLSRVSLLPPFSTHALVYIFSFTLLLVSISLILTEKPDHHPRPIKHFHQAEMESVDVAEGKRSRGLSYTTRWLKFARKGVVAVKPLRLWSSAIFVARGSSSWGHRTTNHAAKQHRQAEQFCLHVLCWSRSQNYDINRHKGAVSWQSTLDHVDGYVASSFDVIPFGVKHARSPCVRGARRIEYCFPSHGLQSSNSHAILTLLLQDSVLLFRDYWPELRIPKARWRLIPAMFCINGQVLLVALPRWMRQCVAMRDTTNSNQDTSLSGTCVCILEMSL